ncbi:M42 family metallopeptidase [Adlercreutzia muris]|jgi:putative aminopeptidase FrvX|uniref:M42 family metallopeptidase n=1 Tax=Adlercreutzia muris TaxID=1796610 RepID=A0A7C8FZC3_9ACTN|nr:M42 family metallopeptidase [Adlercreutzia muris]MCI8305048.1 M42 family metallopeptidase [Enterorhabdus sp.]KAB1648580.1 M42 family metallopeptidase [Adlercreutzia muris]MCI9672919.1 M42 family metallopeptidase [Enterorhabdus sp.]MCR2028966.1 M42 family metallopeptidase [Adlercreutzia muris]NCA33183.1 M42 family peptidase [Adlercreutzia muris]
MKKKQIKFLKQLVETPSPTGFEEPVAALVRERLGTVADEVSTDTMGSVSAVLSGTDEAAPSLMLAAHMDEIGLMVTYISPEGFLSVASLGGVDAAILPGMRVDVHTAAGPLRGIVGRKPIHLIEPDERKAVTPLSGLVIDLGLKPKRVKKLVSVGDPITFAVGFERFGDGMAVSKCFDDKCGVWVACRVMEKLAAAGRAAGDFIAVATTQEEIGTRGAMTSAHAMNPDVALAFDVTHATDYPGIDAAKYGKIVCGAGPVIARGPNINPVVFERLVAAAKAEGIPYQLEAEPSVTGTDARAIQVTRDGIPTGLISVPLRYMHTPTEVVCLADLDATVRLITRFARDLGPQVSFVPGMGAVTADDAGVGGEADTEAVGEE